MSSEALERAPTVARELREWAAHMDHNADSERIPRSHEAELLREAAALLAEVARLEQRERDQAGEIRDLTECMRVFRAQVARLEQGYGDARAAWHAAGKERDTLRAALAVAREREQPMREALEQVAAVQPEMLETLRRHNVVFDGPLGNDPKNWQHVAFSIYTRLCEMDSIARAALVDEPAAATLAEPETPTTTRTTESASSVSQSQESARAPIGSGSASAASRRTGRDARMSTLTLCERCKQPIHRDVHRVRLELVDAIPGPSTVLEGDFHHACAAELFHRFHGTTRGGSPPGKEQP